MPDLAAKRHCACRAFDPYDCYAIRYGIQSFEFWDDYDVSEPTLRELVDIHGGPCECRCHDEDGYDDED